MHPEIQKFWEDAGFDPWPIKQNGGNEVHWMISVIETVAYANPNCSMRYYLAKEWHDEKTALRIIKMKAFL